MKKIVFIFSLIFSLHGLLTTSSFLFFKFENFSELEYNLLFNFQPFYYKGLVIQYTIDSTKNSSTSTQMSLLNLFFYLTFLAGTIFYFISKYKETRLLLFNYSLMLFYSIISFLSILLFLFSGKETTFFLFLNIAVIIFHFTISLFFIKKNLYKFNLQTYKENINGKEVEFLENASKSKRFFNLIIDSALIISVFFWLVEAAETNIHIKLLLLKIESVFGEKFGALVFFASIKFLYYALFEMLFSSTPAKFLTNCSVSDEEGLNMSMSNILVRTICRFIPLESLSFLNGSNLHDKSSYSYVINNTKTKISDKTYFTCLAIVLSVFILIYFYKLYLN